MKRAAAIAVLLAAMASTAAAQETRAGSLEQQRTDKAKALHPYEPSRIERILFTIEDQYLLQRFFNAPRGVFVRWGALPEGAGFGAGPAVRYSNHTFSATATSVITVRRYWEVDGRLAFPNLADRRMFVEIGGRRRDFPQEDFYGLGPDSAESARSSYAYREQSFDALAGVRIGNANPTSWLTIAGGLEYLAPEVGEGRDPLGPSTDALFTPAEVPGLVGQPDFLRAGGVLRVDTIDAPFGTSLGGRYTLSYDRFADRDTSRYSFTRLQADLQHFFPIVNNARSLALHARYADLAPDEGHEVPFYLQPTLGGGYSLRGLPAYRLRDRSLVLFQAEYRWQANSFIAGALFYDAGTVAPRPGELDFRDLTQDYGIGVRLGYLATAALRADLAFGTEGPVLVFKFSNVF